MVLFLLRVLGSVRQSENGLGQDVSLDLVRPSIDRRRSGLVETRKDIDAYIADLKRADGAAIGSGCLDHQLGDALKALGHPDLEHRDIGAQRFAALQLVGETGVKRRVILDIKRGLRKAVAEHRIVKS